MDKFKFEGDILTLKLYSYHNLLDKVEGKETIFFV
jgi:hypothetical protein